ncbi:MAG: class I SAM-dependent methyltransferase [Desulfobacterales bacterium]|nr:class I SAM-dependent methyltransferase [Desulfobacterales bacterium]
MMKLSDIEFKAMNNPVRRFFQKHIEFRNFRWLGLTEMNKHILEIGCGSGYGAVLLSALEPTSYIGIDLMPEQIALTGQWHLPGYEFKTMDAADMKEILSMSKDIIVIFGILHHIPQWREAIKECRRVLTNGGRLFIEEPDGSVIRYFDKLFHWGHAVSDFSLIGFEKELAGSGFTIIRKRRLLGFGTYHAQVV